MQAYQAYTLYCHVAAFIKGFSELFYALLCDINAIRYTTFLPKLSIDTANYHLYHLNLSRHCSKLLHLIKTRPPRICRVFFDVLLVQSLLEYMV